MTPEERCQRAAEAHLAACHEALIEDLPDSPASAPFCGCDTCTVREVLHAAFEELMQMANAEINAYRTLLGQLRSSRQYDLTDDQWDAAIDVAIRTVANARWVDS